MKSKFTGGAFSLAFHRFAVLFVSSCTLFLAYPMMACWMEKWRCEHTFIDGKKLTFDGHGIQLFGNFIKWALLTLITFGIYSFWLSVKFQQWITSHTHFKDPLPNVSAASEEPQTITNEPSSSDAAKGAIVSKADDMPVKNVDSNTEEGAVLANFVAPASNPVQAVSAPCKSGRVLSIVALILFSIPVLTIAIIFISYVVRYVSSSESGESSSETDALSIMSSLAIGLLLVFLLPFVFQLIATICHRKSSTVVPAVICGSFAWLFAFLIVIGLVGFLTSGSSSFLTSKDVDPYLKNLVSLSGFIAFFEATGLAFTLAGTFLLFVNERNVKTNSNI